MPNLAHVWVMIELHVIPNGFLKRCFYLSFYISPLFLIPFQVFIWLNIFKDLPFEILLFSMDVVYFLALPVYRLSRSVAISCFSMLGISTTPPETVSEPVNLQIVKGSGSDQTKVNTNSAPVIHSFSFSCAASIPFQLIMFPVPILPEDDDDEDYESDEDDDDSDFEEASMYLEHDPDTHIEFIEFSPEPYFTTYLDSPIRYPSIDNESSDTSSKGRLCPSLDSILNDDPSSIPSFDSPTVGPIWNDDPSSSSSSPVQSIDMEVCPNQGSITHEHPSSVDSSSPPQAIDKGIRDDIITEVLSPCLSSLWNPARQFSYKEEDEVVTEFDSVEEDVSVDFDGLSRLPYGLPQVDWWIELPPKSESSRSSSSLFFPEVKLVSSVYESVDVNVSSRVAPEEVEKSNSISRAIREARTVISRSNTDKASEPSTEWTTEIHDLLLEAQHRWLRPSEVFQILRNYKECQIATEPPVLPPSGSIFLIDRKVLRLFIKDGHNWRKKRDGKTIKEVHERLKCGGVEMLNCYYSHSEDNANFQRRTYWLLEEGLSNVVLVHYRDTQGNRTNLLHVHIKGTEEFSSAVTQVTGSYERNSSLPYNIQQENCQIPSQTTDTSSYSCLSSEQFDLDKNKHAKDVEHKVKRKKIHHLYDQPQGIDNELTLQQRLHTLKEASEIKGWETKDKECIDIIKLKDTTAGLVRMEDQIKKVTDSLNIESGGVLFVGIHGTSGVGKTSLAKLLFSELADQFEGCSLLHNIREAAENWGLKYLQDQLSKDIGNNKDINHEETNRMEDKLLNKKVLIVLDDVSQREQINNLVGKGSWFGSGSRIIVTTQDPRVLAVEHDTVHNILKWPKEVCACELRGLTAHAPDLALLLFCKHAFGEDSPPYGYRDISIKLMQAIGGLPLALEIMGSFLNRKPPDVWDSTLERLRNVPPLEVKEKLLISYESLEYATRQIFFDIACFFCNKDESCPVYMWDACNFFPRQGLEVLTLMCLVKIRDDNKLWMHDQVKEFGREMARIESFNLGLAWCSRLWVDEEALDALRRRKEEKREIEALSLGCDESLLDLTLTNESFGKMQHLRFLELQGAHLTGNFMDHLQNLRWLQWHSCPGHCEATNLKLYNLVILDLSRSQLSHEWSGWSQFEISTKLKVLNLTSCKSLYRTRDFSSYKVLERLILEDCTNLVEVDESIGLLQQLQYLNLNGCTSLLALPRRIGELTSLMNLEMDGSGVAELPFDIGRLVKLNNLVLSSCLRIEQLPLTVGYLTLLVHLDLGMTKITELPDSIGNMKMLKVLKIEYGSITKLPKSIGMLESLEELHARHCEDLVGEVPDEIVGLFNLRMMDLSFSKVWSLPRTIKQLFRLQTLCLESCDELQELPELPDSLVKLTITLSLKDRLFTDWLLQDSANKLEHWIGKLTKLEILELLFPNIFKLEVLAMSKLRSLCLYCRNLEIFPQFPASLSRLILVDLNENIQLSALGNLKKLTFLELNDCSAISNTLESLGVGQIESLEHLSGTRCNFTSLNGSNLPKRLRVLRLSGCELLQELDLTGLINLIHLDITSCNKLEEILGLGEVLCLEEVSICSCDLLEKLGDLSKLEKLEGLKLNYCAKLKEVEGYDKIKSMKNLHICGCHSLANFHDKSAAKKQKRHFRIKA